ncbi:MAG: DJ-1/PfpI family protein [Spirochaetaceae bacterium]|nr:DJ-1/PfpI family protein [Spirochaetaceae bacterium]
MKVYVFLAEGFEETEAIFPADIMRRAGLEVLLVACGSGKSVRGAHGITITADVLLDEVVSAPLPDAVVLPGGMPGAVNLAENDAVRSLVLAMNNAGRVIAAICASPAVAFGSFGVLKGKSYTCYPGMEKEVPPQNDGNWKADRVVVDGNLVTSRGPGTAGEFGFALVDELLGSGASAPLKKGMLCSF